MSARFPALGSSTALEDLGGVHDGSEGLGAGVSTCLGGVADLLPPRIVPTHVPTIPAKCAWLLNEESVEVTTFLQRGTRHVANFALNHHHRRCAEAGTVPAGE